MIFKQKIKKTNKKLPRHLFLPGVFILLLSIAFGFSFFVQAQSSSSSYNLRVMNLGSSGGEAKSSPYNSVQSLDYFSTGVFTGQNYIVKAGYLYFKPPNQPLIGVPQTLSTSSISWNFEDRSADEEGFLLQNDSGIVTLVLENANISSLVETGLIENQQYTRAVAAFNTFGNSILSDSATACTFVDPRSVSGNPGTDYMEVFVESFPRDSVGLSQYFTRLSGESWQAGQVLRYEGLDVNSPYTWQARVRNICGDYSENTSFTACTLARVPGQPDVSYVDAGDTYNATIVSSPNGNPLGTEYTLQVNGLYVQADGTLGENPYWQTSLVWEHYDLGKKSTYVYRVAARNCDQVQTDWSAPASLSFGDDLPPGDDDETLGEIIAGMFEDFGKLLEQFKDNPLTQLFNQVAAVPALAALALANLVTAASLANVGSILSSIWHIFTEPFLFFAGRRKRFWGVVYNSLSKVPVDLALVRLLDAQTGQLISTRVTDRKGRFAFLTKPGKFRISVTKVDFDFPSKKLEGKTHDVGYDDLYFGEDVEIKSEKTVIAVSIPLDPLSKTEAVATSAGIISRYLKKRLNVALAFVGPIVAAISVWISPNVYTISFLVLHIVILAFFARVIFGKKSKPWGRVYNAITGKPVGLAVVRIFNKKYNDLLETQVTDRSGRFGFLVGPETYRITVDKENYSFPSEVSKGFKKYRGEDFTVKKEGLVQFDIPIDPGPRKVVNKVDKNHGFSGEVKSEEDYVEVEKKKSRDLGDLSSPDS